VKICLLPSMNRLVNEFGRRIASFLLRMDWRNLIGEGIWVDLLTSFLEWIGGMEVAHW
jgi:hypothetical protein